MRTRIGAAIFAIALAFGATVSQAATPAPVIPDTLAGKVLSAWLTAFDSGSREQLRQFVETYAPEKLQQLDDQVQFSKQTGGFDLRKIVSSASTKLTALVQERDSDTFAQVTLVLQEQPPHHLSAMMLMPVDRPAEFALPHLTQAELVAALNQRLPSDTASDRFSGAVLVAKNGAPVFERAYGLADREHHIPNTVDTRFRIGSMNKMFTATAIMQLVQAGKIDLDKPFGTYLTNYPNKSVSNAVTIRQLLTHTGGTGDIFGPQFAANRTKLRTLQDYISLYGNRPLRFKPGSKWEYSNYGFILLGAVIEKVSRQSYYDYVRDHIFVPAGMTSTGSDPEDAAVANRSIGYMSPSGTLEPNTDTLPYRGTSAGGGYSTAGDLLRFADALLAHKLLDERYTEMMTSAQTKTPGGGMYGFGFSQEVVNAAHCFGHNGGAPGMNGDLKICPQNGYVVAVLSNLDPPAAGRVSDFIANRLPVR
jgi:CubicO group peptidase (beta-lactamase class C family)